MLCVLTMAASGQFYIVVRQPSHRYAELLIQLRVELYIPHLDPLGQRSSLSSEYFRHRELETEPRFKV